MKAVRATWTVAIVIACAVLLDRMLQYDPIVKLNYGYAIVLVPDHDVHALAYGHFDDVRRASWIAESEPGVYRIFHHRTGEVQIFESKDEWDRAAAKQGARTMYSSIIDDTKYGDVVVAGVTAVRKNGRHVIGKASDDRFFLFDMKEDVLRTWDNEQEWAAVVRSDTMLDPLPLHSPSAWWVQYRSPLYYACFVGYAFAIAAWLLFIVTRSRPVTTSP